MSETLIQALNQLQANTQVLAVKTQFTHWNIVGNSFFALHKFTDQQYSALNMHIDQIAEHIRTFDYCAIGSLQEYLQLTTLSESCDSDKENSTDLIEELLKDHLTIIADINDGINSSNNENLAHTADLLTDFLQFHEKSKWMYSSYLSNSLGKKLAPLNKLQSK